MTVVDSHKETLGFQTEVNQLLKLMIHSLYSNKEIFLRELISNAADACDKLRFEGLSDDALYESDPDLKVTVSFDKEARTLTVADNGIGMTREEVIENIGTIAKSGTAAFVEQLTGDQAKDANLIGQFGVGFYSAFMVADKVTLDTRRAGLGSEHGCRWESDGQSGFTLETVENPARGTEVTLHLREGEDELLNEWQLKSIITRYSDHITLPVYLPTSVPAEEEGGEPTTELKQVNSASALWARPRKEISDEDYQAFYKHVSHDYAEALSWTHNRVEGKSEYTSLLYVPGQAPFDFWDRERQRGIKLYVQRVFIMDDAENLMPNYMRFVRGVVDSSDLPLNVSREILQSNKTIDSIRAGSVKKVLGLLEDMAKNKPDDYVKFWEAFGMVMKEGPAEDTANAERIAGLLRFASTHEESKAQNVSLADYVSRMQEGQESIYYITADGFGAAKNSPHLEIFRKRGIEVLLLSDRVDEWLMAHLFEFDGNSLRSVAKGDLDLDSKDEEAKKAEAEADKSGSELVERAKKVLEDLVQEVRISHRLTDSPSCLVTPEGAMSPHLERVLREAGQAIPSSKPILELNPDHKLVQGLRDESDDTRFAEWARLMFDQAVLSAGEPLEDPAGFVRRLNQLLLATS